MHEYALFMFSSAPFTTLADGLHFFPQESGKVQDYWKRLVFTFSNHLVLMINLFDKILAQYLVTEK